MKLTKVAVIGDADSVIGFRGIGIKVIATDNYHEALEALDELAKANYGVVFITEYLAAKNPRLLEKYKEVFQPAVILIPSSKGGKNFALETLRESVKKAVGMDFLNMGND
ncbi:MAG TPA: V-type ATP synthase subunit F [Candidatus Eisenbacteria bacterium]|nr:V-type ATP synthase subunit F [Candidatus Eisenbacteria bacterium]